ncbi:MAG: nuclear transport factor 2 family protein [Candidatus Nanoarchaeia archaeon]|nr:nuclear transport factor 2 family protein [Candidatus Nanoarchaeia archaeon]
MNVGIKNKEQFMKLWTKTYNTHGKPDWSHILPYYSNDIYFKDSIQEIKGIEEFKKMVERLTDRSNELEMIIYNIIMKGKIILFEWEMKLSFGKYPKSSIYGSSRITLDKEGKIKEQRDYYDLWGDIFDNIPWFAKHYRNFMKKKFG